MTNSFMRKAALLLLFLLLPSRALAADTIIGKALTELQTLVEDFRRTMDEVMESITAEPQVLYRTADFQLSLLDINMDSDYGPSLRVRAQNTSSQGVVFQAHATAINNAMIAGRFSLEVPAGKEVFGEILFSTQDFLRSGITSIEEIEMTIRVYDSLSWWLLEVSDPIVVRTSAYSGKLWEVNDQGEQVWDADGLRIVMQDVFYDHLLLEAEAALFVENTGEEALLLQLSSVTLNGRSIAPIFSCELPAGKVAYPSIAFSQTMLAEEDVESLSFIVQALNPADYSSLYETELLTVHYPLEGSS